MTARAKLKEVAAVAPEPTLPASLIADLAAIDRHAVELLAGSGPGYFNPLIGELRPRHLAIWNRCLPSCTR